jgi:hypothetical protein
MLLSGFRIPASDHAVGTAAEQRAVIVEEYERPDRQSRTNQSAQQPVRGALDDGNGAANARGSNKPSVMG